MLRPAFRETWSRRQGQLSLRLLLLLGLAMTGTRGTAAEQLPHYLLPCANATKMFRCPNHQNRDRCFLFEVLCDGNFDCPGKEDERYCTECKGASVLCEDHRCGLRCDGVADCPDGRDEARCPHCRGCGTVTCERLSLPLNPCVAPPTPSGTDPVTCARLCDGMVQCDDGKDEAGCGATVFGHLKCGKNCYANCDGKQECVDPEKDHLANVQLCPKPPKCRRGR